MKKLLRVTLCLAIIVLMAGCAVNSNQGTADVSSDKTSSEAASSKTISSEAVSSEQASSEVVSSQPAVSSVAASSMGDKKNDVLIKPSAESKVAVAAKISFPESKYPISAERIEYNITTGSEDIGFERIVFYEKSGDKWNLIYDHSPVPQTSGPLHMANSKSSGIVPITNIFKNAGEYKLLLTFNGSMEFEHIFKIVTDEEYYGAPFSTDWSVYLDKEIYPVGTESVFITTSTGNGMFYKDFSIGLYIFKENRWQEIPIPITIMAPDFVTPQIEKPNVVWQREKNFKGYLDKPGSYKFAIRYSQNAQKELFFTVE